MRTATIAGIVFWIVAGILALPMIYMSPAFVETHQGEASALATPVSWLAQAFPLVCFLGALALGRCLGLGESRRTRLLIGALPLAYALVVMTLGALV